MNRVSYTSLLEIDYDDPRALARVRKQLAVNSHDTKSEEYKNKLYTYNIAGEKKVLNENPYYTEMLIEKSGPCINELVQKIHKSNLAKKDRLTRWSRPLINDGSLVMLHCNEDLISVKDIENFVDRKIHIEYSTKRLSENYMGELVAGTEPVREKFYENEKGEMVMHEWKKREIAKKAAESLQKTKKLQ